MIEHIKLVHIAFVLLFVTFIFYALKNKKYLTFTINIKYAKDDTNNDKAFNPNFWVR